MIILLIFVLLFQPTTYAWASTSVSYYARIMQEDVLLYKTAVDANDFSNVYFSLPRTYFVELLDDTKNGFYFVNYLHFSGYVKKDAVQTIVGTPITPYLTDISFRVYSEQSRDLRSEPTTISGSSSQVAYIPLLSRNLTYLGSIIGEELIDGRTNIWYYCKYSADKDYYGYVYSDFCDELAEIPLNTEQVVYTSSPNFDPPTNQETALPLKNKTTMFVIAVLSIPALIFMFMIFKNKKILSSEKVRSKEIIDY